MSNIIVRVYLKKDSEISDTSWEEFLDVKKVIHTNGGHLRIIFQNNSEIVFNASTWKNYLKTII